MAGSAKKSTAEHCSEQRVVDTRPPLLFCLSWAAGHAFMLILNSFILWGLPGLVFGEKFAVETLSLLNLSCFLSNIIGFALFSLAMPFAPQFFTKRLAVKTCILLCSGFSLLAIVSFLDLTVPPVAIMAGIFIGLGSSFLFCSYVNLLDTITVRVAKQMVLIGTGLMVLLHLIVYRVPIPLYFSFVLVVILPLNLVFLLLATRSCPKTGSKSLPRGFTASNSSSTTTTTSTTTSASADERTVSAVSALPSLGSLCAKLWMPLLCISTISIVAPMVSSLAQGEHISLELVTALTLISFLLVVGALAIWWFGLKRNLTIPDFYLVFMPIVATSLLMLPFLSQFFLPFLFFLGTFGFLVVSVLAIVNSLQFARKEGVPALMVFGIVAAVMYLSRLLGVFMADFFLSVFDSPKLQYTAAALLLLYVLTVVLILALRKSQLSRKPIPSASPTVVTDVLNLRCKAAAKQYGLTERSSEVLHLLVHGRSIPFIASTLHLSENTVRSHAKKIYSKMNLHNRQQLIDLVENLALEDGDELS